MAKSNQMALQPLNVFSNIQSFEDAQRMAKVFVSSPLVPDQFRGDLGSVLIAFNLANRTGADPLQVMQNIYIVHGKPAFSSSYLIACFNQCGRYSAIRYVFTGEEHTEEWGCKAVTTELATGEVLEGTKVTIAMAKREGWYDKRGSKWQTMPELMLQYRSATFLIRTHAPEIALGFQTREEVLDITDQATIVDDNTPTSLNEVAMLAVSEQAQSESPTPTDESEKPKRGRKPKAEALPEDSKDAPVEFMTQPDISQLRNESDNFTSRFFEQHNLNGKNDEEQKNNQ